MKKPQAPHIDFSLQFKFARSEDVERAIMDKLASIADDVKAGEIDPLGAIVVLGHFDKEDGIVPGMLQMKPQLNPIAKYINVTEDSATGLIAEFASDPFDGAIVVEKSGQIIGAGVYLVVEHPSLEIPDGCGTRHKAAASFSTRDDVIAVFTLSEENNLVRVWKRGKVIGSLE